jgi:acyl-CoA thioester hydrolase
LSLPVVEAYCRYRKAVTYDELIRIKTRLAHFNRAKIRLEYQVYGENDKEIRIDGYTIHCFTNQEGKPVRAPEHIIHFFQRVQCL